MKFKINPELKDLPVMSYEDMENIQGNLKDLKEDNYQRLKKDILKNGMIAPFALWEFEGKFYILDGNQRKHLFTRESARPAEVPYFLVPGKNLEEAKEKLLSIASQYGTVTQDGYDEFTIDLKADQLQEEKFFDSIWEHFTYEPDVAGHLLSGEGIHAGGGAGPSGPIGKASLDNDEYGMFELIMRHENRDILIDTLNRVKQEQKFDKHEQALMFIINDYNNSKS